MKKELLISVLAAGLLTMTGCGSSSDDGAPAGGGTTITLSAQFIDSPVEGLSYDCQSSGTTGTTNSEGIFHYVAGDTCTFKVGDIVLGSTQISGTTTPRKLTTVEPNLTNILRLLQTLDSDENPSNGITLPTGLTGDIDLGNNFDAEINTYLANNNVTNAVVTPEAAKEHFAQSVPMSIDDSLFIGKSYTISFYSDQSTIAFKDDHTYTFTSSSNSGTWSIQNDILILKSGLLSAYSEYTFFSGSSVHLTTYYVDANNERLGETTNTNLTYTVSTTPETPDPTPLILTTAMFSGMTYTYGESGTTSNQIITSFSADGTFSSIGDGDSSGTWTITDNRLVMTDTQGTTTIKFLSDTIAHAIAQDIGQPENDMGEMPYTSTVTVVDPASTTGKEETLQALRSAVDESVTAESVLTTSGYYYTYGSIYSTGTGINTWRIMGNVLITNNSVQQSEYNTTSDSFEVQVHPNLDLEARLINGVWSTKTDDEWEAETTFAFNADGTLTFSDWTGLETADLIGYSAVALNIKHIADNSISGEEFNSTQTFSTGAMAYEFQTISRSTYQPNYSVNVDENYEKTMLYSDIISFDELIVKHNEGKMANFYNLHKSDGSVQYVYLTFPGGDAAVVSDWNGDIIDNGTYTIETISNTEILVPHFSENIGNIESFALVNGQMNRASFTSDLSTATIYNEPVQFREEVSYPSVTTFTNDHNTSNSSIYCANASCVFADNNVLALFNENDHSALDVNGTYEIKMVGSEEVLVLNLPNNILDTNMQNSYTIFYSMVDSKLRRGYYRYAEQLNNENFFTYNETAARDIYNLILSQESSSSNPAPARSGARTVTSSQEQTLTYKQIEQQLRSTFH